MAEKVGQAEQKVVMAVFERKLPAAAAAGMEAKIVKAKASLVEKATARKNNMQQSAEEANVQERR